MGKRLAFLLCSLLLLTLADARAYMRATPDDDPHYLTVVNGDGDGNYRSGKVVPILATPPSSERPFEFVSWIQTSGDGHLADSTSSSTTFTMGYEHAEVVAVFARLKTWFPPGNQSCTTGLLLPQALKWPSRRLEQLVHVDTYSGDSVVSADQVFALLNVKFDWQEQPLVGYYSVPSGFSKIQPGKNLDKAMFSKNGTNAFEASLWYEGLWKTQDYSGREFPKVTTTLTPVFPGNRIGTQVIAKLLPVDIKEVASDQINDSECNKLPTAKYAGEPNNPMLMATRTGVRAHLAIKVESPEGFRDKIYVGARKVGATTILGSVTVKAPNEKTKLEFDAIPGHEIYEVVAGYDQNGNAALDNDEAQIVFKKTPAGSATSGLQYLDKIIIVTESQFGASKGTVAGYNVWGTGYAGDLIEGFSKGSATISGATTANNVDISANEPGLSHPVGGRWNPDCKDKTYRFTFADASSASNDFEGSNAFEQIVEKVLRDNIAALVAAYDGSVEWAVSSPYTFNESKNLIETEAVFIGFNKLGLAFGKVDIGGTIRFSYKKTGPNSISVGSAEVIGNFDDLYDFAYGGGDQARQASMVQAGHATLAKAPEANAGKVFFTRLEFNSGWKNWNRNYTNP